jgi:polysaccharide biosynthesis protein PslF
VDREGLAYLESLRALIEDLEISHSVTLRHESLPSSAVWPELTATDIVLLPYKSRWQTSSGVLVEALAAGRPAIVRDFPPRA